MIKKISEHIRRWFKPISAAPYTHTSGSASPKITFSAGPATILPCEYEPSDDFLFAVSPDFDSARYALASQMSDMSRSFRRLDQILTSDLSIESRSAPCKRAYDTPPSDPFLFEGEACPIQSRQDTLVEPVCDFLFAERDHAPDIVSIQQAA